MLRINGLTASVEPGLDAIDDGNGIGWRSSGRDSSLYGLMGRNSVDFSTNSSLVPSNYGTTGEQCLAFGDFIKASGFNSIVFGYLVESDGIADFNAGVNLKNSGYTNTLLGTGHDVSSMNVTVVGQAAEIIDRQIIDYNASPDKELFVVGNGTIQNNDSDFTVLTRSNAFQVHQNGNIFAPSLDIEQIASADGKIITTKEYIVDLISDGRISVKNTSQIANIELDSTKVYVIESEITLGPSDTIIVPETGLTIQGHGFNISSIFSYSSNHVIFTSPIGGSGDLVIEKISITNIGVGSKTFDIVDVDGTHAIELEYVNFSGCKSLGKIDGYRQGTMTTAGIYGCADGLQLSGTWNGFKISNTNVFGFGASGTLFKKDVDTIFNNRLFLNINTDFATGSKLIDFNESNFSLVELLQINSSQIKVNGAINDSNASALIPNISPNNEKCRWVGNVGLPDSALDKLVDDSSISGTHNIDWLIDTHYLIMTGNTTFTESNLPANLKNTKQLTIYLQGEFIPTFPSNWDNFIIGTYKGIDVNEITIRFIKTGVYIMKISNSLTVYPAPFLQSLDPTSLLPSSITELTIYGSFFTPATIVSIENQTVNSVEFINQGELLLSVTTSAIEEEVDITISNGTTVVFSGVLPINLGVVYIPSEASWTNITGPIDLTETGRVKITSSMAACSAVWEQELDFTKDWILEFQAARSILALSSTGGGGIYLRNVSDNSIRITLDMPFAHDAYLYDSASYIGSISGVPYSLDNPIKYAFKYIDGIFSIWRENLFKYEFATLPFSENLKPLFYLNNMNIINIKYIELPI